jgi:hypothetical protein
MTAVVLALVFIPFGKFFHVLQRPASVGIQLYTEVNLQEGRCPCAECGEPLASGQFLCDLEATLADLGQDYRLVAGPDGSTVRPSRCQVAHLVELCPRWKRVARARAFYAARTEATR